MSGCNCAHCHNHCGEEDNENIKEDSGEQNLEDSSLENDNMDESASAKASADKVEKLKQAIIALGFNIENTEKGLRISR